MATDVEALRSRRALLVAAVGAAAATVATAVSRPLAADAADGEAVVVGGQYDADSVTQFSATAPGVGALLGHSDKNTGVQGTSNSWIGVEGDCDSGPGVYGLSVSNAGVLAESTSGPGLQARSAQHYGVMGTSAASNRAAVLGRSDGNSTGVVGASYTDLSANPSSPAKTGVYGFAAQDATAVGVKGESTSGTGVLAAASTGRALDVHGRAKFSQSGRASIPAKSKHVDVTVPGGLSSQSVVHATMQTYRAGVSILGARPNWPTAGKIRIYLTRIASTTAATPVGWFVTEF